MQYLEQPYSVFAAYAAGPVLAVRFSEYADALRFRDMTRAWNHIDHSWIITPRDRAERRKQREALKKYKAVIKGK